MEIPDSSDSGHNKISTAITKETESIPASLIRSQDSGFSFSISSLNSSFYTIESNAEKSLRLRNSLFETHGVNLVRNEEVPAEIELCSLLNRHKLPLYKLRVDPSTAFIGYKHKDFRASRSIKKISTEKLTRSVLEDKLLEVDKEYESSDEDATDFDQSSIQSEVLSDCDLTDPEIENCFSYFLLCGLRISQMSQTYEDIEAVTHLLEEKQNDLELAAKIGRKLLDQKQELEKRLTQVQNELQDSTDTVQQLRYQLSLKDSMLQDVSRDLEYNQHHSVPGHNYIGHIDDDDATSISSFGFNSYQSDSGAVLSTSVRIEKLHRKIQDLQEENILLQQEHSRLNAETDDLQEQETGLVKDCVGRLAKSELNTKRLQEDLYRKSDDYISLHFKYTQALNRVCDLETGLKQAQTDAELMRNQLAEWQVKHQLMAANYRDYKDRYDECLTILAEAQRESRRLRKEMKAYTRNLSHNPGNLSALGEGFDTDEGLFDEKIGSFVKTPHSLATELHYSALKHSQEETSGKVRRAMENSRTARRATDNRFIDDVSVTSSRASTPVHDRPNRRQSVLNDFKKVAITFGLQQESNDSSSPEPSEIRNIQTKSRLKNSRLRKNSVPIYAEDSRPKSMDLTSITNSSSVSIDDLARTHQASQLYEESYKKLPQRLQLVKPIDGSQVLERWQQLAAPSGLGNALFETPVQGVAARGSSIIYQIHSKELLIDPMNSISSHVEKSDIKRSSDRNRFADPPKKDSILNRSIISSSSSALNLTLSTSQDSSLISQIKGWGITATASALSRVKSHEKLEHLPTRRKSGLEKSLSRPKSITETNDRENSRFSLGALMMSILPEQFWHFIPESDQNKSFLSDQTLLDDDPVTVNTSVSSDSYPEPFSYVSSSSKGLLEASILLTDPRLKGASLRTSNAIVVDRLSSEETSFIEQCAGDDVSINSSLSGNSNSDSPSISLISKLVSAPPVAKMRSPRGVYRPAGNVLRTLAEEEDCNSTSPVSSLCSQQSTGLI